MVNGGADISSVLQRETPVPEGGFPAVVAGTGPNISVQGVPDMAQMLLASAQEEVVITTPYYVPSEAFSSRFAPQPSEACGCG